MGKLVDGHDFNILDPELCSDCEGRGCVRCDGTGLVCCCRPERCEGVDRPGCPRCVKKPQTEPCPATLLDPSLWLR